MLYPHLCCCNKLNSWPPNRVPLKLHDYMLQKCFFFGSYLCIDLIILLLFRYDTCRHQSLTSHFDNFFFLKIYADTCFCNFPILLLNCILFNIQIRVENESPYFEFEVVS